MGACKEVTIRESWKRFDFLAVELTITSTLFIIQESHQESPEVCAMGDKREKVRALVVDDEAAVVTLLCARLTMEGYETKGASNAEEARARLEEEQFDLVICDLRMPGMTGLELLKEVRVRFPRRLLSAQVKMTCEPASKR
jgi:PleD family two-component response regulator